jgi:hypothetical protein
LWIASCLTALPPLGVVRRTAKDRVETITGKSETSLQPDGWFVGKATVVVNGETVAATSRTPQIGENVLDDGGSVRDQHP